ncbi:cytidine deaminase [Streptomyces sp. 3213]|uniref:cytidine deaminase n=1 Tax=Streptomyces sp. 3213.3 TaxID=1855348 RepID=UPI0008967E7B|nr:cytidine deaminase [Streptomyces sp. 3213.3]SEE99781.1 cytidine deaminase [Streptomyces sp. 3213] [Streptomyces sp. 3213.3]
MSAVNVRPVTVPPSMHEDDVELLATAQHLLARVWQSGRHEVATALRTADGRVHTGVHVEGSCRRSSICAEGVAMGTARGALPAGAELSITSVVSVQIKPAGWFRIIAPCGLCRELISDYCPDATVWVTTVDGDEPVPLRALDLLPEKSRRRW